MDSGMLFAASGQSFPIQTYLARVVDMVCRPIYRAPLTHSKRWLLLPTRWTVCALGNFPSRKRAIICSLQKLIQLQTKTQTSGRVGNGKRAKGMQIYVSFDCTKSSLGSQFPLPSAIYISWIADLPWRANQIIRACIASNIHNDYLLESRQAWMLPSLVTLTLPEE